ncbi:MAG: saccharopine dehydrogenase NADP-binding domain-containing protein [Pseudomonadales bacterium]|nr:saccharopine dehydrogenase NADP-binding domain-containing protein [Pseudomonadales bacterium]
MTDKTYDIVVFGATSFVGQIICQYLVDTYGVAGDVSWAIAGRSESKLALVKQQLGGSASGLPVIVADAANESQLKSLCEQTQVVLSTVGPYALYGEPLIKACVETGTDYCDLTGEVQWIKSMLTKYEAQAKQSGARIVHCCGFDSIPSDMGVYFVQQYAKSHFQAPCQRIKLRVKVAKGEFSGGTVASLMNVANEAAKDPGLRKQLADPYLIADGPRPTVKQPRVASATHDKDFGCWLAPFVMEAINSRIVMRSNSLLGNEYGDDFQYDEALMTGAGPKGWLAAQSITVGMGGFMVAAVIPPSRWLLEKFVLPAPGEGPSPEVQRNGFFDIRFYGETTNGQIVRAKVTGDRDPGYGSTAKMIAESSICLAKETAKTDKAGGFWTTASVFGERLIKRLQENAGLTFEIL